MKTFEIWLFHDYKGAAGLMKCQFSEMCLRPDFQGQLMKVSGSPPGKKKAYFWKIYFQSEFCSEMEILIDFAASSEKKFLFIFS